MKKSKRKDFIDYLIIILVVILLRTFVVTPAVVRQQSMEPTLFERDVILINKLGKFNRFDVVVIDLGEEYIIKRVIGLPGEHIEYIDNKLYVNGKYVEEAFLDDSVITVDFDILNIGINNITNDSYFVLGDNRTNSTDSRVIGVINKKDIIGKTN
ncbi:MAG: signal peptidase I, partial [Bacilli bacterium]|nr:signal peptidase I [Bacilli bacterium]